MWLFGPPKVGKLKSRRDVKGLLKALTYPEDSGVRRFAALALGELGDPRAVDGLDDAIDDENRDVRVEAVLALGKVGGPEAVPPLCRAVNSGNKEVVQPALVSLGQVGDGAAVPTLLSILAGQGHESQRIEAARALGRIRDSRACDSLLQALGTGIDQVSKEVVAALEAQQWNPKPDDRSQAAVNFWVLKNDWPKCSELGEHVLDPIWRAVYLSFIEGEENQRAVIRLLGNIGHPYAAPVLVSFLGTALQEDVLRSLTQIGPPAVPVIRETLEREKGQSSSNQSKVTAAIQALTLLGGPESTSALLDVLQWYPGSSARVQEALTTQGSDAIDVLCTTLLTEDREKAVTTITCIVKTLGDLDSPRTRDALVQALARENRANVKWIISSALEKLGWEPGRDRASASYWAATKRWDKCLALGDVAVVPLRDALQTQSLTSSEAETIADGLGEIGTPEALLALEQAYGTADLARKPIIRALGRRCTTQAVEHLKSIVSTTVLGEKELIEEAMMAIARSNDPSACNVLKGFLVDSVHALNAPAAKALAATGEAGFDVLASLSVTHLDLRVSDSARQALQKTDWEPTTPRQRAALAISESRFEDVSKEGKTSIPLLLATLKRSEPEMRAGAARALGEIGDKKAIDALARVLRTDRDYKHRPKREAARALSRIGGEKAAKALVSSLSHVYNEGLEATEIAILELGTVAAPALVKAMERSKGSAKIDRAVLLDKIGWRPESVTEQVRFFLAREAQDALVELGEQAIEPLSRIATDTSAETMDRVKAITALEKIDFQTARSHIFGLAFSHLDSVSPTKYLMPDEYETFTALTGRHGIPRELMRRASSALSYSTREIGGGRNTKEVPSLSEGDNAVRELCLQVNEFTTQVLRRVATMKDMNIDLPSCNRTHNYSLDFSQRREMARDELNRRASM